MSARRKRSKRGGGSRRSSGRSGNGKKPSASLPTGVISISFEGYGFVETPEGRFFIPTRRINGAMDGDTVRVRPSESREPDGSDAHDRSPRAPKAAVDRVLDRAHRTIVGLYVQFDGIGYVIPQDKRMDYLVRAHRGGCPSVGEGDVVVLAMDTYPSKRETPSGTVERILGRDGDPGIIEEIILARHGIETSFSPGALEEAEDMVLDIEAAMREPDRHDLRDRLVVTIDPVDAKDFDDALSLEYVDGLRRLGVHIADVSHYVKWGGSIDLDARRRTTSTYFPGRVIPMLPEKLSCDLCSLNPGKDRLAFTVDLYLDDDLMVVRTDMYPSVIRSSMRLDYDSVQEMLDGMREFSDEGISNLLAGLARLGRGLYARRMTRGALDFESIELKVELDEAGAAAGISRRVRTDATNLVEEAMILANEAVASFMLESGCPMVYRVHDEPSPSSLDDVVPVLRELGYAERGLVPTNRSIKSVLDAAKGKPEAEVVDGVLLRAMRQAVYKDSFTTHFGLASAAYTHFTSPIRRYPDLMAHRLLRRRLFELAKQRGEIPKGTPPPSAAAGCAQMAQMLSRLCERSSVMERESDAAAYEVLELRICEYMEPFVGETFDAMVVSVASFGFFVRIPNGCEGLVPIGSLDGWYEFDGERRVLEEADSPRKRRFFLGQRMKVKLVSASRRLGGRSGLTFRVA